MRSNLNRKLLCSLVLALALPACGGETLAELDQSVRDDPELSIGDALNGCREANCLCFASLAEVMDGRVPDARHQNHLGPEDTRNVFSNGGSENIPLTCRTVHHWAQNNPSPAWLESYFGLLTESTRQPALTVGLVGSRSYVNGHNAEAHAGTTGLQGVLLAMALDHPQSRG